MVDVRAQRWIVLLVIALGLTGCGPGKQVTMPAVRGEKLDAAKSDIKGAGYKKDVDVQGGGLLGVVIESNWEVCDQSPAAGESLTTTPRLEVARHCGSSPDAPSPELTATAATPTPTAEVARPSSAPPAAKSITVDQLLDRLNAEHMGGIHTGDRFRFSGELFESDAWTTGATGDYYVYLKAKGGKDDLMVFVKQSFAAGWRDGTKVEMVVEVVERTVNDETTGGWLQDVSVRTISR
jgi:hypothetical protein